MDFNLYFAWAAWITLLIIVLSRPLADLSHFNVISRVKMKRKYLGLLCGLWVLLHVLVYSISFNFPLTFFFNLSYWNFSTAFGWGLLAFVTMLPLLVTSNIYSIRLLKRNWVRIQKLTYLFFIASGIHIYMIGGKWLYTIVPMSIWAVVWIAAYLRNRSRLQYSRIASRVPSPPLSNLPS